MKKSIICLGMLVALSGIAIDATASNLNSSVKLEKLVPVYGNATPLCVAIYKGEIDFVKKLIAYGADVNEKSNGLTPLMIAARFNKVEIMKLLIANGAKVNEKNEFGIDAKKYAQLSNANDAYAYLALNSSKKSIAQR